MGKTSIQSQGPTEKTESGPGPIFSSKAILAGDVPGRPSGTSPDMPESKEPEIVTTNATADTVIAPEAPTAAEAKEEGSIQAMAKTKTKTRKVATKTAKPGARKAKPARKVNLAKSVARKTATKKAKPGRKPAAKKPVAPKLTASGRGKRYSATQQKSLLEKYHALRAGGKDAQAAARSVGVSYLTLRKWEKNAGIKPMGRKKKADKSVRKTTRGPGRPAKGTAMTAPKTRGGHLTLVTPDGHRVEGIHPKDLRDVLNALK
jgi:hypothetical protein